MQEIPWYEVHTCLSILVFATQRVMLPFIDVDHLLRYLQKEIRKLGAHANTPQRNH